MLKKLGATDVDVAWVPGAFEISPVAARMANTGSYSAVICLGTVIRGSTAHFDYVAGEAAKGIAQVARESAVPVIFGVLTTIIAFLPWLFVSGATSEFTRQITWVVILALAFSLIESLFILPAHLSKMKPVEPNNKLAKFQNRIAESIVRF